MKRKRCRTSRNTPKQIICISLLDADSDTDDDECIDRLGSLPETIHACIIRSLLDTAIPKSSTATPQLRLVHQFYQLKAWRSVCHAHQKHVHKQVVTLLQSEFYRPKRQIGALSIRECSRLHDIMPYHTDETDPETTWSLYSALAFYTELERHPIDVADTPASSAHILQASDDLCRYFVQCNGNIDGHSATTLQPLGQTNGLVVIRGIADDTATLKAQIKRFIASHNTDQAKREAVALRLTKGPELQRRSQFYACLRELHAEAEKGTAPRVVVARADAFPLSHRPLRTEEMGSLDGQQQRCDLIPRLQNLALCVGNDVHEFLLTSEHPQVIELRRSVVRTIGPASRSHAQYAFRLRCAESIIDTRRESLILQCESI